MRRIHKVSPEKVGVAAAMLLLAHVGPVNSSVVALDRRQRTPWLCPASVVGSWDYGMGWLSRHWHQLIWFVVDGAMVCGLPYPIYYSKLR